jgi:hypothetical protein
MESKSWWKNPNTPCGKSLPTHLRHGVKSEVLQYSKFEYLSPLKKSEDKKLTFIQFFFEIIKFLYTVLPNSHFFT